MADAPVQASFIARPTLFKLGWLLLAISLLIPAPEGLPGANMLGGSALYVYGKAIAWDNAGPGFPGSLGFWPGAILALALYSHIAFLYSLYMGRSPRVAAAWKGLLLAALGCDAAVALLVPELARLPAYWVWLAAMTAVVAGFFSSPGGTAPPSRKTRPQPGSIDNGDVPPLVWVLLGCTLFWVAVSAGNHLDPAQDRAAATSAPLTGYVNDGARVLTGEEVSRLTLALQKFEAATTNQVVVAIYPRAPAGAIEEFTIRVADRSHLGRIDVDTGAILSVFMDARAARLEVGYGLEGALTDAGVRRMLESDLAPAFARGAYFDGLDATLKTLFASVQDATRRDGVPGNLTVWGRHFKPDRATSLATLWRAVSDVSLLRRIGLVLFCAFIAIALWSSVGQWGRLSRDIRRGIVNRRAGRPTRAGMERVDGNTIVDSVQVLFWSLGIIIPAAGVVIIAAGGAFGGAGALVHW